MPAQSVAQNTKLCSLPIALMLPGLTSLGAAQQPVAVEGQPRRIVRAVAAARGIVHDEVGHSVLPGMGSATADPGQEEAEPGGQPGCSGSTAPNVPSTLRAISSSSRRRVVRCSRRA